MAENVPIVKLSNGYEMPAFAFGTYKASPGSCKQAVKDAIDAGYRHIDTAFAYLNEKEVGEAVREKIAEGVVKREDLFIVTKLWVTFSERVEEAFKKSMEALNIGYVDLYLVHAPISARYIDEKTFRPMKPNGEYDLIETDHLVIWRQMEKLVEKGWVRSIGVSNFNSEQVLNIYMNSKIKPVCNQVECSPAANQRKLAQFCNDIGVTLTGYSPLAQNPDPVKKYPRFLYDDKVGEIAKKYGKSSAQVIFRFCYEMGVVPIVKSVTKTRIVENIDIFDFQLTPHETSYLNTFESFQDRINKLEEFKHSNHFPFRIEF